MTTSRTLRVLRAVRRAVVRGLAQSCMESAAFCSYAPTYLLYSDRNANRSSADQGDESPVSPESSAPLTGAEVRAWAELVQRLQPPSKRDKPSS